jgi:hypothetical protein
VTAEGCFYISIAKNSQGRESVNFKFIVTQHVRDKELLKSMVNYLGCGRYELGTLSGGYYVVSNYDDIKGIIIPFFDKYPLLGIKFLDFIDLKKGVELKGGKNVYLTPEIRSNIREIKLLMNSGRIIETTSQVISSGSSKKMKLTENKRYFSTSGKRPHSSCSLPSIINPLKHPYFLERFRNLFYQIKFKSALQGFIAEQVTIKRTYVSKSLENRGEGGIPLNYEDNLFKQ